MHSVCTATGAASYPTITALMPQIYLPADMQAMSAGGNISGHNVTLNFNQDGNGSILNTGTISATGILSVDTQTLSNQANVVDIGAIWSKVSGGYLKTSGTQVQLRSFRSIQENEMKFPDRNEFLQLFGIEPIEEDPSMALCRYRFNSKSNGLELDISFSAIQESFQILLYCGGQKVVNFVSERTTKMELYRDSSGSGLRVHFEVSGVQAEAIVTLEPTIKCRWWLIRTE